jgi:lysophospholipase L1-like esterase
VTLAALAAVEAALRLFGVAPSGVPVRFVGNETVAAGMTEDRELFWRLQTRGGHDPVHAIGVRGDSFPSPRGPRDLRVLCVGDSCTYGLNVRLHESWGMALDSRLQDRNPDLDVHSVLAAAPGWSTHQDLAFLRRHGAALAADVTILFVGAWNDLLPAVEFSDAQYAEEIERLERSPLWSLRLGRMLWRARHPPPSAEKAKEDLFAAIQAGRAPTPRVSLEEFRKNVEALVALARTSGAVVGIVPPAQAGSQLPWRLEYRRVLADAYRDLAVPVVDADAAWRAFSERVKPREELLSDWVHPTGSGHAALAEAVLPVVEAAIAARTRELAAKLAPAPPAITSVEPASLPPGRPAKITIRGVGFEAGRTPRVFVNGQQARPVRVVGAALEVDVLADFLCKPGETRVALRSEGGLRVASHAPTIRPWTVDAAVVRRGDRRALRVSTDTESTLLLQAWISPALLEPARETAWGPLFLKDPSGDHPAAAFDGPLSLLGLRLPSVQAFRPEPGPSPLTAEAPVPPGFGDGPFHAQVLIRYGVLPEAAWLSGVLPARVE